MPGRRMGRTVVVVVALVAVCILLVGGITAVFTVPALRELVGLRVPDADFAASKGKAGAAKVVRDADGRPGIALTKPAIMGLQIKPVAVRRNSKSRPLPPLIGTVNFDNETLFSLPARFPGEIADIKKVDDAPDPAHPTSSRPVERRYLRYGDRVKQGDMLCVVHSVALGTAKAALVDAVCSLALSKATLKRQNDLFEKGAISLAQILQSERQVQADSNSVLTAERTLLAMKMTEIEVQDVKNEAKKIAELAKDETFKRDAKSESERWSRLEVTVPWFDKAHADRELVVVEKNTNLGAMIDPIATGTALFKVADVSRMQIWVHPAEEFLPIFRRMLDSPVPGGPFWNVSVPSYPDDKLPPMRFTQIAPVIEPFQHAPLLMGYLDNPKGSKYIVGQFLTATIDLPPEPDTLEVPTEAINEVGGQALVLVQPNPKADEFILRRVSIVQRFKDVTIVRRMLTVADEEENLRNAKLENPKRPIEPLSDGALVVTRGVVELTTALENLLLEEKN